MVLVVVPVGTFATPFLLAARPVSWWVSLALFAAYLGGSVFSGLFGGRAAFARFALSSAGVLVGLVSGWTLIFLSAAPEVGAPLKRFAFPATIALILLGWYFGWHECRALRAFRLDKEKRGG